MKLTWTLKKIRALSRKFALIEDEEVRKILKKLADELIKNSGKICEANKQDLDKILKNDPIYDRVLLDKNRVKAMADSVRIVAYLDSPVGVQLEHRVLENGLDLRKVSVPFGVVGVIFEARPNVIIDIFALCFKSKNCCVLKGGSQAENSNKILIKIIKSVLGKWEDVATLLPNDRNLVGEFLKADKYVDVIVPRGGQGLIEFVRKNSSVPVIETGAGVVHVYFDKFGDVDKGREIVFNSKISRPSVCNALDTLIIHNSQLKNLRKICRPMEEKKVEIYADKKAFKILEGDYSKNLLFKAELKNFGKEYLSLKMSIKTVDSMEEAIEHINTFGSGHSESIVTEDRERSERFLKAVDAACVYVNASTRFTDGEEFGIGAEVGVSTQKLHARGPMGLKELTSYKWEIRGDGQVRW